MTVLENMDMLQLSIDLDSEFIHETEGFFTLDGETLGSREMAIEDCVRWVESQLRIWVNKHDK